MATRKENTRLRSKSCTSQVACDGAVVKFEREICSRCEKKLKNRAAAKPLRGEKRGSGPSLDKDRNSE